MWKNRKELKTIFYYRIDLQNRFCLKNLLKMKLNTRKNAVKTEIGIGVIQVI